MNHSIVALAMSITLLTACSLDEADTTAVTPLDLPQKAMFHDRAQGIEPVHQAVIITPTDHTDSAITATAAVGDYAVQAKAIATEKVIALAQDKASELVGSQVQEAAQAQIVTPAQDKAVDMAKVQGEAALKEEATSFLGGLKM